MTTPAIAQIALILGAGACLMILSFRLTVSAVRELLTSRHPAHNGAARRS